MKKGGGFLILSAIGLDSVIQHAIISFFYPEIINVSNHSRTQTPIWKDHREIIRPYRRFPACWRVVATDGADGGNRQSMPARHHHPHQRAVQSVAQSLQPPNAGSRRAHAGNTILLMRFGGNWGCKNRRFRQPAPFGRSSESSVSTKFPNNIRHFWAWKHEKHPA